MTDQPRMVAAEPIPAGSIVSAVPGGRFILASALSQVPTDRLRPLSAITQTVAFSSRDWSSDGRDGAWLYGIVCGWDDDSGTDPDAGDAMSEVAAKFGWSSEQVDYLRALRRAWVALEEAEDARS